MASSHKIRSEAENVVNCVEDLITDDVKLVAAEAYTTLRKLRPIFEGTPMFDDAINKSIILCLKIVQVKK